MSKKAYYVKREYSDGFIKVKTVLNPPTLINSAQIVGYCHNCAHNGYITKSLLKSHNCIQKNCSSFEKLENYPYWEALKLIEENKQKKKQIKKDAKKKSRQQKLQAENDILLITKCAQSIADKLGYPIVVTGVRKSLQKNEGDFVVNYVSNANKMDLVTYIPLTRYLREVYGKRFTLCKIKNIDGSFASIDEWKNSHNIAG